jgi:hypothetical protein
MLAAAILDVGGDAIIRAGGWPVVALGAAILASSS